MRHLVMALALGTAGVLAACSGDSSSGSSGGSAGSAGGAGSAGAGGSAGAAGSAGGSAGTGGSAGGGGNTSDAGDGGTAWDAYCQAAQAQHAACSMSFDCTSAACIDSVYEPPLVDDYTSCLLARSCGELGSDDDCFASVGTTNGQLPPNVQAQVDACLDKQQQCGNFSMDACAFFAPLVLEAHKTEAAACVAKPCAEVAACFAALSAKFDCIDQ